MTAERRAAAQLRRAAAEQAGERGGDAAFQLYRASAPGIGTARKVPMRTDVRAEKILRDGKELVHTKGFFTRYNVAYPMWDQFGEYEESVAKGAGRQTLASKPDVAFLVNHGGVTMARTVNDTLVLEERAEGGWHDAYLNPRRVDVSDLVIAIEDGSIDQMSFAFMIPDDGGLWNEDFTHFEIRRYDINRGDVSAVNYGASPYTDISARTAEVLNDLEHLPMGALRAAEDRLIRRGLTRPEAPVARERIEVAGEQPAERTAPVVVARGNASKLIPRLHSQLEHTSSRLVELAIARGFPQAASLLTAKLPWYEIRNADGDPHAEDEQEGWATVYVYDDIGGSMGVTAKQFEADLSEITAPNIGVRINSPGGSVADGITIHSSLLHHPATVRSFIDGWACSAASVVAMAADPLNEDDDTGGIVMMPGAQLMIHDASMNGAGQASDWRAGATFLDRQSANIAAMYAARAGGEPDEWRALMLAETWAIGQEAVDLKLADKLFERKMPAATEELQERMARTFDVSGRYRFNGRRHAPKPYRLGEAPMVRRATVTATDPAPADGVAYRKSAEKPPEQASDRQNEPKGRSIALIQALLEADEMA